MRLHELIAAAGLDHAPQDADALDAHVEGLAYRSEAVEAGFLFFCVRGFSSTPPLAIAPYAAAIWIGVTAMP